MIKILIVQETLTGGGAEKVLINLLKNIDYTKYEVDLLLLIKEGIYLQQVDSNVNVRQIFNPIKTKNTFINRVQKRVFYKLLDLIPSFIIKLYIRDKYDYQVAFLEGISTKLLSKCTKQKSKKVAWVHIDLEKYKKMPQEIEGKCYKEMDEIICVSNEVKSVVDKLYPLVSNKTKVVYNLIDTKDILLKSNENINYIKDKPVIIGVGRLVPQKRFDLLIKAHSELIKSGIDNKLLILGSGYLEPELIKLINDLNVVDTVEIKEFIINPYPYIKSADVFVMSSDFEGFSLVVAEALVLGKCIVSTECAGPVELLSNGEFGQLIKCDDVSQLKNAIEKVIINGEMKEYYEKKALIRAEIFNSEDIMNEIYNILK